MCKTWSVRIGLFCGDFYSGVIQCFAAIVNHLNSIFADYSGDWFIPFVGDDVVPKCISNLKKNKAAFDTQKGANLGLKCAECVWTRLGSLSAPPDPLAAIGGRCAYF